MLKGSKAKQTHKNILSSAKGTPYGKPYVVGYYKITDNIFIAFDNTTCECRTEEFASDKQAEAYCAEAEANPNSPIIVKQTLSDLIDADADVCKAVSESIAKEDEDEVTSDNKLCPVCGKEFPSDKVCSCGFSGKGIKLESPIIITVQSGCISSVDGVPSDKYVELRDYDIEGTDETSDNIKTDDDGEKYILSIY